MKLKTKSIYLTIFILSLLLLIPFTSASFYTNLYDDWAWDTGTNYDNYIWDDYGTIVEIRGEDWSGDDADAVCIDFDNADSNGFDYCFYDGTVKECDVVSQTFADACDKGCQGDYSGEDIDVTSYLDYDGMD